MSGSIGGTPIGTYLTYAANEAKYAASAAKANAQETGLIAYFRATAPSITSPDALLKDYKALTVVLGAFGIGNLAGSTALVRQLITQDPSSTSSTAYRIGNAKYLAFAHALHSWSPPPFATAANVQSIVTSYQENAFEAQQNSAVPGLQKALAFTRQAGSITSLQQLQSDPDLLAVAVSGVGLPLDAFANLTFEQQSSLLASKLKLSDLQEPSYVRKLAENYLVQQQLANPQNGTPAAEPGSIASLFTGNSSTGNDLLGILQATQNTNPFAASTTGTASLLSLFA